MIRKVDELGRIVIPIELRRNLGINIKDPLEIFVDGNNIVLSKYSLSICKSCNDRIDESDIYCKHCGHIIIK